MFVYRSLVYNHYLHLVLFWFVSIDTVILSCCLLDDSGGVKEGEREMAGKEKGEGGRKQGRGEGMNGRGKNEG